MECKDIEKDDETITKSKEKSEEYKLKGLEFYDKQDYDNAIKNYDMAISLDNNNSEAYYNRGNAYGEKQEYDKAIEDYTKAVEIKPDYAYAYNNRGIAYGEKQEYDKAIEDYTKAIEIKPDYAKAYYNRGIAYGEKQEYDKEIEDYTKAIEIKPDYVNAYYNRGIAYKAKQEYDKAIEDYTKVIDMEPDDADAYNNRGITYRAKQEYDKAIEDYTKAIEIKPDYTAAYNNRGITYKAKQEYDKAIEDYTKAIEIKPDYAYAYYNRGLVYGVKQEYDKAIRDYSDIIEIAPNDIDAYNRRAAAYKSTKQYDKAKDDENKVKALKVKLNDEQFYNYVQAMDLESEVQINIWDLFLAISDLKELFLNTSCKAKVAHYTKLSTLKFLIKRDTLSGEEKDADNKGKNKKPSLRLNNVAYMNDPSEGTVFLKLIKQTQPKLKKLIDDLYITENIGSRQKLTGKNTFLVSLSRNIDTSLPMWTQYTGDGQGACLVFDPEFFDYKDDSSLIIKQEKSPESESINKNVCKECYCLYKVRYIKWDDNEHKYNIENTSKLQKSIKSICDKLASLNITKNTNEQEKLKVIVQNLLDQVRFLFKDDIYSYEEEERIIKFENDPKKVNFTGENENFVVPHTYIEIDRPLKFDEVILGPKVTNPTEAANYIYFINKNILVSKSRIQYQ